MPSHSRKYTRIPVLLWLQMDLRMLAIFVFQGFNDASAKFLSKDVPRQQFASSYCSRDTVFSFIIMVQIFPELHFVFLRFLDSATT